MSVTRRIATPVDRAGAVAPGSTLASAGSARAVWAGGSATAGAVVGGATAGRCSTTGAGATATRVGSAAAGACCAGCGAGAGAGGAGAAGAEGAATGTRSRAGRKRSGSRYPSSSSVRRTPRCTCGACVTASALSPTLPTRTPSATASPRPTVTLRSWRRVTERPSLVWIVSARPPFGTEPANETVPPTGACTASPTDAPTSIPRCWPPA